MLNVDIHLNSHSIADRWESAESETGIRVSEVTATQIHISKQTVAFQIDTIRLKLHWALEDGKGVTGEGTSGWYIGHYLNKRRLEHQQLQQLQWRVLNRTSSAFGFHEYYRNSGMLLKVRIMLNRVGLR